MHRVRATPNCTAPNLTCSPPTTALVEQVKQGVYAVYSAISAQDAATVGTELQVGSFAAMKAYCDATPACIGLSVGSDSAAWRAFSGIKWADAVGKVRVVGETLNGVTTVSA